MNRERLNIDLMLQKYNKYLPVRLELIPLVLLAVSIYIAVSNYPGLPQTFPSHINTQGMVDRWGSKGAVFAFPGICALLYIVFTAICVSLAVSRDPRRFVNMPRQWKKSLTDAQVEKMRYMMIRYLFWLKLLIMGMMTYILSVSITLAKDHQARTDSLPLILFTAAIIITIILMLWSMFRLTNSTGDEIPS